MKNKLTDLNNHLFAQLERLGDETLKETGLKLEIERSKAIAQVSNQIVSNAALALRAEELRLEYIGKTNLPEMLEAKKDA
ncbi:hypothetical protein DDN47_03030 [Vibrio cholerae]|nr:hypothetical protein [Vibrio cholerae]ELE2164735.1 hypothetical protein [Vibrio fluvialis]